MFGYSSKPVFMTKHGCVTLNLVFQMLVVAVLCLALWVICLGLTVYYVFVVPTSAAPVTNPIQGRLLYFSTILYLIGCCI